MLLFSCDGNINPFLLLAFTEWQVMGWQQGQQLDSFRCMCVVGWGGQFVWEVVCRPLCRAVSYRVTEDVCGF
jgi:hypothetical protein